MGLAQVGPIEQGTLREGREARVLLSLPAGCLTIVAIGGDGVRDLDATLLDGRGHPLAHDTTSEPQAVLRPCLEAADSYPLVVKAQGGEGTWIAAAWAGGIGGAPPAGGSATPPSAPEANGSCAAPIPLGPGTVTGSTTHGEHENAGSCGPSDSRELVYELDIAERERVIIEVEASFDSVLYVRKEDCNDAGAEVDCNDDAPDRTHSRIDRVLEPGKYFVFVDGYGHEGGAFKLTVTATQVLALAEMCARVPSLGDGTVQSGSTAAMADDAHATCGGGAEGADAAWRAELTARSRVRVVEHSDDVAPVVHVRRACADEESEVACGESGASPGDAVASGIFGPGGYTVFADAHEHGAGGRYTLRWETSPTLGSGSPSDACGDAMPVSGSAGTIAGDTFNARDDVSGSCGGTGAADVIYRLDVARRSRLTASLEAEEAPHLLVAWRRCGDRNAELACGPTLNEVVTPGTYYVAVDGTSPSAFGRFTLVWSLRDLTAQATTCADVPTLVSDRDVIGSTVGAGDRFATLCGSASTGSSGPDRVFKIVLAERAAVKIALVAPAFDAVLALRKACADAPAGPPPELACEVDADSSRKTTIRRTLEPGAYFVVVDGQSPNDQGPFTLEYHIAH